LVLAVGSGIVSGVLEIGAPEYFATDAVRL
jgi:hypothetical protein